MKKFTFIAMLMLVLCGVAKADDKYFFKVPTDKMASGWVIQDAGNFESTPGKEYLEVYNKKNGGRMLNYFWNEDAWSKVDVNTLPNSTYKYTMDLNMSSMAARSDMEFDLLPVNACTATDSRVSTHNFHWFNNEGEDYFFRFRVGEKPAAVNGDFTILINENPTAKDNWPTEADNSCVLSSQKTYKFAVSINVAEKTATYTISDEEGNQVATGVHKYVCEENRAGIFVLSMNGTSKHQLSNIGLSYEAEGPFANEPTSDLLSVVKTERDYYVNFKEGETLHWTQLGDATDVVTGTTYSDGETYELAFDQADDKRSFEAGEGEYLGNKIIYCTKSGTLKLWTTCDANGSESDAVEVPVVCENVTMPTPKATITNVNEGYAKEYQLTADNSETLMQPVVTIHYTIKDASGKETSHGEVLTGEKVTIDQKGSLEIYSCDATNPEEYYLPSAPVTIENNVEYVEAAKKEYNWDKDVCSKAQPGFSVVECSIDTKAGADGTLAAQSHWERVYSNEKRGVKADGTIENWVEGTDYVLVREGWGIFTVNEVADLSGKWNTLAAEDPYTAFAPLVPKTNDGYVANGWRIFPYEGIVYYSTSGGLESNNAVIGVDAKYISDDASKPNFYVVHTRGGYDRPDKGDCNATTVCVAGENYGLYRYDTALCDVKVLTYKGFVPGTGTGISSVNAAETVAPTVKKVATKNGIVIVKGDKVYSVTGAQIK